MRTHEQLGRAAGLLAKRWLPAAKNSGKLAKQWVPTARQSGAFVKHVIPAAVKPIHSLWHEVLGSVFLIFAAVGVYKVWQHLSTLAPMQLALVAVFIAVMAGYGISSIRKARRISRS